jgi:hypothetical protein
MQPGQAHNLASKFAERTQSNSRATHH